MDKIKNIILKKNKRLNLQFEENKHIYSILNNIKLSSVTTKISKYFPFDAKLVSREIAEKNWTTEEEILNNWEILRQNGSYIHNLAEKYCNNKKLNSKELELISNIIKFFKENSNMK